MAEELSVQCPKCESEIKLTDSITQKLFGPIRRHFEAQLAEKDAKVTQREAAVKTRAEALDDEVAEKVRTEKTKIATEEAKRARLAVTEELDKQGRDVADLQAVVEDQKKKLSEAHKGEAEVLRMRRELEEDRSKLDLEVERRLTESRQAAVEQGRNEAKRELEPKLTAKDESLAELKDRVDQLEKAEAGFAEREKALRDDKAALSEEKLAIDAEVAAKVKTEKEKIAAEEAKRARLLVADELEQSSRTVTDLQTRVEDQKKKLADAHKNEADLLRMRREVDEERSKISLEVERRLQDSLGADRVKTRADVEDEFKLKLREREHTIEKMQRQVDDLKRSAEQGSQQLQGEVHELELETTLVVKFPRDLIEPVPKGVHGGDVVHRIIGPAGHACATFLWEAKRTKNWSDGWLAKLREDQRAASADIAILVSHVLPKGIEGFGFVDGVWVSSPRFALVLGELLRHSAVEVWGARKVTAGQRTKTEMVYEYLTGPRFRHRIEAVVEYLTAMKEDLDKERRTTTRLWAKRDEQMQRIIEATAGMYGDLQGIAGKNLQEIEGFALLPESPSSGSEAASASPRRTRQRSAPEPTSVPESWAPPQLTTGGDGPNPP